MTGDVRKGTPLPKGKEMTKKMILAAALASIALPATAQTANSWLAQAAQRVGAMPRLEGKGEPAIRGQNVDAAKDPWQPMTWQRMAAAAAPGTARKSYSLSAAVDWNGDGVTDIAYLASNRTQIAVIVRLGANKGTAIAFRAPGAWGAGEELVAAGKRRLILNVPESAVAVLSAESGKPLAYFAGD